jgi:hypothetical protein
MTQKRAKKPFHLKDSIIYYPSSIILYLVGSIFASAKTMNGLIRFY